MKPRSSPHIYVVLVDYSAQAGSYPIAAFRTKTAARKAQPHIRRDCSDDSAKVKRVWIDRVGLY